MIKPCRECRQQVSDQAWGCPHCGAPYPTRAKWDGWGFEYKSKAALMGLPLVHVSFKYRPNRLPVPARGVIAIGQFACGILTISQSGTEVGRLPGDRSLQRQPHRGFETDGG
jgi:hypothetical protein